VVANVGDSRGVMCDSKGNAIPLSFDHKPQQVLDCHRDFMCYSITVCSGTPIYIPQPEIFSQCSRFVIVSQ
jgi:hypothetical protein